MEAGYDTGAQIYSERTRVVGLVRIQFVVFVKTNANDVRDNCICGVQESIGLDMNSCILVSQGIYIPIVDNGCAICH